MFSCNTHSPTHKLFYFFFIPIPIFPPFTCVESINSEVTGLTEKKENNPVKKNENSQSGDLSFDQWVEDIQQEIWDQEAAEFSPEMIAEYRNPVNVGRLKDPDGMGTFKGPCGDTMIFDLKINPEKREIAQITFLTDGCGPTIACGSRVTRNVTGKTLEEAKKLTPEEIEAQLGGLPDEHKHCPVLAVTALQKAIQDYLDRD